MADSPEEHAMAVIQPLDHALDLKHNGGHYRAQPTDILRAGLPISTSAIEVDGAEGFASRSFVPKAARLGKR